MITKARADEWITETGGDPWGYDQPFVLDRFDKSLEFIRRFVRSDFAGVFIEIGAFNGAFTARLAPTFSSAGIVVNDLSDVAISQARVKLASFPNVHFSTSDMSTFSVPQEFANKPIVLILMETLYYLPKHEQGPALKRLLDELRSPSLVFISGPIQGKDYFDEHDLLELFGQSHFSLASVRTLNTTDAYRGLYSWDNDRLLKAITKIRPRRFVSRLVERRIAYLERCQQESDNRLDRDSDYRRKYGRQVMYCFKPTLSGEQPNLHP